MALARTTVAATLFRGLTLVLRVLVPTMTWHGAKLVWAAA